MKIQIIDSAAKIYKASMKQDPFKCVRFKFFTNYMLVDNQKLKIFDFSENVLFHNDQKKFIITRINEFTNEMEIHVADWSQIKERLEQIDFSDQSLLEIQSYMKESFELQKLKKIVSVNFKDEHFIIVMTDRLLIYHLESLIGTSSEKATPQTEVLFSPILVSFKPYVSAFVDDKIYLFQKNVGYKSMINQLIINYKLIDCIKTEKPQLNLKIPFQSPIVAQATETMLSYISKVKIYNKNKIHLRIYTEFKNQSYKQKVIYEQGEPLIIKPQKQQQKQSDFRYIPSISSKNKHAKLIEI